MQPNDQMSASSSLAQPSPFPGDSTPHRADAEDLALLYKIERMRRESLELENERLITALNQALQRPPADESAQAEELERLRAELDQAHRQNLIYASDLAASYSGERSTTRALAKTQEQLTRSKKLATLGQMVAAIAHDVKNMIGPVDGYAELMLRMPDTPEVIRRYAMRIRQAAAKSLSMVQSLTSFGANRALRRDEIKMERIVHAVIALLEQNLTQKRIKVVLDLEPNVPSVEGDEGQLEQVLINLIVNAEHAMAPRGGVVRVEVRNIEQGIRMSVTDQGHGIPEELQSQLFEPFFTTKEPGKGTGLGLFISHDIIERHGGTLDVSSTLGVGTTFTITLPSRDLPASTDAPQAELRSA
ncbi:MAG TPA: ATP-binding protein [Planctomycetota bacterium]|nr:ATP-binding protein [Planctomycetota bacterium]